MKWKKPSPELSAFLADSVKLFDAEKKQMFGAPVYFVNNNMFAGVHQDSLFIRLSAEEREGLASEYDEAAPFEPMAGRIMKEYMVLPETILNDPIELKKWLEISYRHTALLPRKEPKLKKKVD